VKPGPRPTTFWFRPRKRSDEEWMCCKSRSVLHAGARRSRRSAETGRASMQAARTPFRPWSFMNVRPAAKRYTTARPCARSSSIPQPSTTPKRDSDYHKRGLSFGSVQLIHQRVDLLVRRAQPRWKTDPRSRRTPQAITGSSAIRDATPNDPLYFVGCPEVSVTTRS